MDSVTDAEQLVSIQDNKFGVGNKYFGRLIAFYRLYERVDSVAQVAHIRLYLIAVELDDTSIVIAHLFFYNQV